MALYSSVVQGSQTAQTELDDFIPEMWADAVDAAFKTKLILGQLSNDYSSLLTGGGDIIHVPTINEVTAAAAKTQYDAVAYTSVAETKIDITVQTHMYASCMVEDMGKVQSSTELLGKYANSIAYRLAYDYEDALEAKLGTTTNGMEIGAFNDTSKTLDRSCVVEIVRELYENNVNPEDCWLVLNGNLYSSLFDIDDFVHITKSNAGNFINGQVGTLMGLKVMHSPRVNATFPTAGTSQSGAALANDLIIGGYVVHNTALASAFSKRPTINAEYDIDYIAHKLVGDNIYGCALMQDSDQARCWALVETGVTSW